MQQRYKFYSVVVVLLSINFVTCRLEDLCNTRDHVALHSIDMVTDYRHATSRNYDTGRFKRDMQGGKNINPGANQFWVIYKSITGFKTAKARIYYYTGGNFSPSDDRRFYISTWYNSSASFAASKKELTSAQFTESVNVVLGDGSWFYRDYTFTFPPNTHFFEFHFRDWIQGPKGINYWSPQIGRVSLFEGCDPLCGNSICGELDYQGRKENCLTCPQDCGNCPTGSCGDGTCELLENWAPSTGQDTTNLGGLTCPQDCGFIEACGNGRCDSNEACRSQTQESCSADCCILPNGTRTYTINPGQCGNDQCDGSESCSSCPSDCGKCPECGNGKCDGMETCLSCPSDCGSCSTCAATSTITSTSTTGSTTGSASTTTTISTSSTTGPSTTSGGEVPGTSCSVSSFALSKSSNKLVCSSCCNTDPAGTATISDPAGSRNTNAPPADPNKILTFYLRGVTGSHNSGNFTQLNLYVDAALAGAAVAAQVSYDWTSDNTWDRVELYDIFATNPSAGTFQLWQTIGSDASASVAGGLRVAASGPFKNLVGGTVRLQLWGAFGSGNLFVRTDSGLQPSLMTIPFNGITFSS